MTQSEHPPACKGIIFDLDGTLLDTIGDIAEATNIVLSRHGFPEHTSETLKTFIGEGIEEFMFRALPETVRDPATVREFVRELQNEYRRRWRRNTEPYPGIPELLNHLADFDIRLGVLSNKPQDFTREMVRERLPRWRFDPVLGANADVPRKPDPEGALSICRIWRLKPSEIILLGDSEVDIETAHRAGMTAAGAAWGFRTADTLKKAGADYIIHHPADLLSLLSD